MVETQPVRNRTMIEFTKPFCEIWEQEPDVKGMFKQIERCGRVSHKSEDKITDDSYVEFVARMKKLGHLAVLEHGTVYLKDFCNTFLNNGPSPLEKYDGNKYSVYNKDYDPKTMVNTIYVTTNYRVLTELGSDDDLGYWCEPDIGHERRTCFHVITDRGVSAEANRHRVNSVVERSSRYVDYSGTKTNNKVRIQLPPEFTDCDGNVTEEFENKLASYGIDDIYDISSTMTENGLIAMCVDICNGNDKDYSSIEYWLFANLVTSFCYHGLRKCGWTAQQARRVLPLDVETEFVHTAFNKDWDHFFNLRCSPKAHPDMQEIAYKMRDLFIDPKRFSR